MNQDIRSLVDRQIGMQIRQARRAKQLTQEVAAAGLKISMHELNQIEEGYQRPRADLMLALAKLYDVDVEDFFAKFEANNKARYSEESSLLPKGNHAKSELIALCLQIDNPAHVQQLLTLARLLLASR